MKVWFSEKAFIHIKASLYSDGENENLAHRQGQQACFFAHVMLIIDASSNGRASIRCSVMDTKRTNIAGQTEGGLCVVPLTNSLLICNTRARNACTSILLIFEKREDLMLIGWNTASQSTCFDLSG